MARQGLRQGPKKSGCGSVTVGTVGMLTGRYGTGAGGCCDVGPWVTVGWSRILCQVRKGFQVIYQYYEGLNHQNLGLNISVWWFQTCFIFYNIWDKLPIELIFFMVKTTNQKISSVHTPWPMVPMVSAVSWCFKGRSDTPCCWAMCVIYGPSEMCLGL